MAGSSLKGPTHWGDIDQMFSAGKRSRHPRVDEQYADFLNRVSETGLSVSESVLQGFFPEKLNIYDNTLPPSYCLFASEYPYWVDQSIGHLMMFASEPLWNRNR